MSVLSQMAFWPRLVVLGNTLPVLQPAEHPPCSKQPEDAHRAEAVAISTTIALGSKMQECKLGNCCLSVHTLPVTWRVLQHTKACQRCCQVSQWKLHAQQGLDSARLQTELQAAQPVLLEVRCVSSCWQPRASRPAAPAHGTAASPCFCSLVMLPGGAAWAELGTTARGKMQGSTLWDEAHIRQLHFTGHLQHAHVAKWGSQPPWQPHGLNTSSPYAVVPVPCKMAPTSSQLSAADSGVQELPARQPVSRAVQDVSAWAALLRRDLGQARARHLSTVSAVSDGSCHLPRGLNGKGPCPGSLQDDLAGASIGHDEI